MSMAGAGIASSVGGGILSGISSIFGSDQTATNDTNKANAARYNAAVSYRNANMALNNTAEEQQEQGRQNLAQLGTIRSAYGASGLDFTGSAVDVLTNTAQMQQLQVAKMGYKGHVKAQQYGDQAAIDEQDAATYDQQAEAASSSGILGSIGAFFGAASSLSGNSRVRSSLGYG